MALSYKARRRWSLIILLVGLPAYIVAAVTIMSTLERPPVWVEFLIYVALGVIWALPFRFVFRGIGKPDPERTDDK
jgi:branched-subunit amino acid transport protein